VRERAVLDPPEPQPTPEEALMAADQPIPDERLKLVFVCCHPALAPDSRAALTLKVVCGLSTERLARAFFVAEPAMLQRITRAKKKIAVAGVPFEVPARDAWPERLEAVLSTLEIAYAQAYEDAALSARDVAPFAAEVLRLSGLLAELMPDEPEVLGLAALVRFAEARRPARLDEAGAMVPPPQQDPSLWRRDLIDEGARLLDRAARAGISGPRQILATIHATHCARGTGATDWPTIAALYEVLAAVRPHAATQVNRAVALGEAHGAEAGLGELARIEGMQDWLPYQAALAHLSAQAGRREAARAAYDTALALGPPPAERLFLEARRRAL